MNTSKKRIFILALISWLLFTALFSLITFGCYLICVEGACFACLGLMLPSIFLLGNVSDFLLVLFSSMINAAMMVSAGFLVYALLLKYESRT